MWREYWLRVVTHLLTTGQINLTVHGIATALAEYSDATGKYAFPSQGLLGENVGRSASTVNRALAKLRALGVLEWEHRFIGPGPDGPHPRGTSNLYEFLIPEATAAAAGVSLKGRNRPGRLAQRGVPHDYLPPRSQREQAHERAESFVEAELKVRDVELRTVVVNVESQFAGDPELIAFAVDYAERRWQALTRTDE